MLLSPKSIARKSDSHWRTRLWRVLDNNWFFYELSLTIRTSNNVLYFATLNSLLIGQDRLESLVINCIVGSNCILE